MEFWAALAGAIVGGGVAIFGAMYVSRRDVTRAHRTEMLEVLRRIRGLLQACGGRAGGAVGQTGSLVQAVNELGDLGILAQPADRKRLAPVVEAARQLHEVDIWREPTRHDPWASANSKPTAEIAAAAPVMRPRLDALAVELDQFEVWLRRRLSGRL